MSYLYQAERSATRPTRESFSPPLNVDVRRRGFDPFFVGLVVGAVAAIVGVLLGLYLFLPL